jgi:hypothetical protein
LQCDFSSRVSEIDTAIATAVIKLIDAVLHSEIAAHFLYDTSRSGKGAVYIDARKYSLTTVQDLRAYIFREET